LIPSYIRVCGKICGNVNQVKRVGKLKRIIRSKGHFLSFQITNILRARKREREREREKNANNKDINNKYIY